MWVICIKAHILMHALKLGITCFVSQWRAHCKKSYVDALTAQHKRAAKIQNILYTTKKLFVLLICFC